MDLIIWNSIFGELALKKINLIPEANELYIFVRMNICVHFISAYKRKYVHLLLL